MWNFDWPKAYPETNAHGILKRNPEDFQVDEIPLVSPCGEGEHIYLHIKKREVNTHWVARLLSETFGVKEHDVSYAGQKDRYAVTTQWFSIYAPKIEMVLESRPFPEEDIEILVQTRHSKKLRRGDLIGNRFNIVLRDIKTSADSVEFQVGDPAGLQQAIENNLQKIKLNGVPNYFGLQRFGRGGGNMDQALAMLTGQRREKNRQKKKNRSRKNSLGFPSNFEPPFSFFFFENRASGRCAVRQQKKRAMAREKKSEKKERRF